MEADDDGCGIAQDWSLQRRKVELTSLLRRLLRRRRRRKARSEEEQEGGTAHDEGGGEVGRICIAWKGTGAAEGVPIIKQDYERVGQVYLQ